LLIDQDIFLDVSSFLQIGFNPGAFLLFFVDVPRFNPPDLIFTRGRYNLLWSISLDTIFLFPYTLPQEKQALIKIKERGKT